MNFLGMFSQWSGIKRKEAGLIKACAITIEKHSKIKKEKEMKNKQHFLAC